MKRNHIQHTIATYLQHQPVDKAWLFGSYARGEATRRSDVDILVKYTPNSNLSLLDHIHIMNELHRFMREPLRDEGRLLQVKEMLVDESNNP